MSHIYIVKNSCKYCGEAFIFSWKTPDYIDFGADNIRAIDRCEECEPVAEAEHIINSINN